MKELPKEFTFICDEHSREQLKKLGVNIHLFTIDSYGLYYRVENNIVRGCYNNNEFGLPIINLSDYIDEPETKPTNATEQKWQEKTRGGYEYHIYEELEGYIYGRVKSDSYKCFILMMWDSDGKYFGNPDTGRCFDLLPFNPRRTEIEQRLSEIDKEREELQKELENLK